MCDARVKVFFGCEFDCVVVDYSHLGCIFASSPECVAFCFPFVFENFGDEVAVCDCLFC